MDYKELLNNIYTQFKSNNKYIVNKEIRFFKENNTNIVNFEVNDKNGIIPGTIIEQGHSVLIYFYIENELGDYIFISQANIYMGHMAIIINALVNKNEIDQLEMIRRNFNERKDLYKFDFNDEIIDEKLDSEFSNLVSNIIDQHYKKNKQKRHKI